MRAIFTTANKIDRKELIGTCSEKMCEQMSTQYILLLQMGFESEQLPVEFFITLCDEHAKPFHPTKEVDIDMPEGTDPIAVPSIKISPNTGNPPTLFNVQIGEEKEYIASREELTGIKHSIDAMLAIPRREPEKEG